MRPTSERNVGWENENSSFHEGGELHKNRRVGGKSHGIRYMGRM